MHSPTLNCAECLRLHKEDKSYEPACFAKACPAAHLMNPGFNPWLEAFRMLRSNTVGSMGARHLVRNHWDDVDSLMIFDMMGVVRANAIAEKQENERRKRENVNAIKSGRAR